MKRLNFTLDEATVRLLSKLSEQYYEGNKSLTVRAALESLAVHAGHEGWVIAGYTSMQVHERTRCHICGDTHAKGEVLFRPVFRRGDGPKVVPRLPTETWLDCSTCVEEQVA